MADAHDRDGDHPPDRTPHETPPSGASWALHPAASDLDDTAALRVDETSSFAQVSPTRHPGSTDVVYALPAMSAPQVATPPATPGWGGGATAVLPRRRRAGGLGLLTAALLLGLAGGGAAGYVGGQLSRSEQEPAPRVLEAVPVGTTPATPVTAIAAHALPSVVFISVGSERGDGVGSGFVVREDGYIVTNSHVIESAGEDGPISVRFTDGTETSAEVVGADVEYDIAVIKVDLKGLQVLHFGDSDQVQVGASVVAVGAPLGLDNTVTTGIVSALNRPVIAGGSTGSTSYINAIQTDAAINPGNSGGPLLDLNGQVVGVNSAIAQIPGEMGGQAGSIGLGFAIPSRQAEHTANQLIETGTSNHPIIGVMLDMTYGGVGARVLAEGAADSDPVVDGGPADQAGITAGELILEVEGQPIEHGAHLIVVLRSYAVGDEVDLLVQGVDGDERTVQLTLQGSE
ncbi:trypsin-like serine protease [Ornithinimicrobium ciconiae]|uniref:Trypsin-like serine protease n=1 Tax=Ornithinimicrobium ciconiae TaxID=2594265 RepID=A0A516G8S1_9MICO|nr:trypsin-like peptidase domain-containing protein [Ornithinimicrobium ciconiae]QDO87895.1 trypsin-like serine protease [Ornithinimicrobium ciconiae]